MLDKVKEIDPSTAPLIEKIKDYRNRKLWFDISNSLIELFKVKSFNGNQAIDLYNGFVRNFEEKLNDIVLSKIVIEITKKIKELKTSREFLLAIVKRIEQHKKKAVFGTLVLRIEEAMIVMRDLPFDELEVKEIFESVEEMIRKEGYVDPFVNSYLYRVKSIFHKLSADFNNYYRTALLFLSFANINEELSEREQIKWAFDIGIAALAGDEIHNFGELLANPIVSKLQKSDRKWLYEVLVVYNKGAVKEYQRIVQKYKTEFSSQPFLMKKKNFLERKIQLMAILELVFSKEVGERNISFEEIMAATDCQSINNVEFILLKALSDGLIKGVINQMEKRINVSWIQPRVLDTEQIIQLNEHIKEWRERVNDTQQRLK